jgi:hypothetical protein
VEDVSALRPISEAAIGVVSRPVKTIHEVLLTFKMNEPPFIA